VKQNTYKSKKKKEKEMKKMKRNEKITLLLPRNSPFSSSSPDPCECITHIQYATQYMQENNNGVVVQ
jgi:hypothetical protein